jgi:extradiol dioxygenase family protein
VPGDQSSTDLEEGLAIPILELIENRPSGRIGEGLEHVAHRSMIGKSLLACQWPSEDEFDQIFGRIQARGVAYWADPGHRLEGEINTHDGGRGVYFDDPSRHSLEIITRPYAEALLSG